MNAPSLALVARITVLSAYWRKLGALLWKMASVFIGAVVIIESPLAQARQDSGTNRALNHDILHVPSAFLSAYSSGSARAQLAWALPLTRPGPGRHTEYSTDSARMFLFSARLVPWPARAEGLRRRRSPGGLSRRAGRLADFEDRGDGTFGAWLSRIAELKAREAVRRYVNAGTRELRRELSRGARPDTARFRGHGPSPSEVAIGREREREIERALAQPPPEGREILHLVRVEGMTLKDAAVLMGRSHDTTLKLYGRALSQHAERLGVDRKGKSDE